MIRQAGHEDMLFLADMGRQFYDESNYSAYVSYDPDKVLALFNHLSNDDNSVLLVSEHGFAGASMMPLWFAPEPIAQELNWWVHPKARGTGEGRALRAGLEAWARHMNAPLLGMSSLDFGLGMAVDAKYRAAGYVPVEHSYVKVL